MHHTPAALRHVVQALFIEPMGLWGPNPIPILLYTNGRWSDAYRDINTLKLSHLLPTFGKLLLTDITAGIIGRYQRDRHQAGASLLGPS